MNLLLQLLAPIAAFGAYIRLIIEVIAVTIRRPPAWPLVRDQMFNIGVLSLPVIAFTGFSTGMVLAAQSFFQLADKGLASATGLMVGKAMAVELGPILTAVMVTGRVGAAMCAELGTMRVTEQVDALQSMAVNPLRHLIAPRFIAGTLMLPLLTIFSGLMGVWGGYIIAVYFYHMPSNQYLDPLPLHIENFDLVSGMVKACFFGIMIVTICCYLGLNTRGGAAGVGKSTTRSVVICYCMILLSNFFLTMLLNTSYNYITGSNEG
jgi:phospholipid/cholesterol/gamma-HCH transport system permease protein